MYLSEVPRVEGFPIVYPEVDATKMVLRSSCRVLPVAQTKLSLKGRKARAKFIHRRDVSLQVTLGDSVLSQYC